MFNYTEQNDHVVPCVQIIITNDKGEILLTHRTVEPYQGGWGIVGGRIDVSDDSVESAVKREVREETGYEVEILNLIDIKAKGKSSVPLDTRFYAVSIIYEVRIIGGFLQKNYEADDFRWVLPEQALKEKLIFDHNEVVALYLKNKEKNKLIPATRSYFDEYWGKSYDYVQQNLFVRFATNAIVFNDKNEILLARRSQKPFVGDWDFPGGHMYVEESIVECCQREILEELGVKCIVGDLFHVYSDKGHSPKAADVISFYFVKLLGQDFKKNIEMDDFKYFSLDNLPANIAYHNQCSLNDIKNWLKNKN
ncbi:MAG: NUDIX hydrolase [Candidatus Magasanikiibacteriota bacterium]